MNRRLRTALAATAVVGAGLLMTACQPGDATSAGGTDPSPVASGSSTASGGSTGSTTGGSTGSGSSGGGSTDTSGDKTGVGQLCGSNDLSWSSNLETQAGGYFLIKVKAKSGITCVLPDPRPVVAFGSDGTEASAAEQSGGDEITLSGDTTAYAGVVTNSTNTNDAPQYQGLIVSVSNDDPDPETLSVGTVEVNKPLVTNWHTSAADVVTPFL
ncbi:DUF4232 domain-containing protein [Streptomyces sp. NPDC002588]|uniref:DUF4232 domain-containing protein n=1 Tax=Streptomyces sp. NPDC002588 TaxID=3154419 RepID=UPI0033187BD9